MTETKAVPDRSLQQIVEGCGIMHCMGIILEYAFWDWEVRDMIQDVHIAKSGNTRFVTAYSRHVISTHDAQYIIERFGFRRKEPSLWMGKHRMSLWSACLHGDKVLFDILDRIYRFSREDIRRSGAFAAACGSRVAWFAQSLFERYELNEWDIMCHDATAFRKACASGRLETVEWLCSRSNACDMIARNYWEALRFAANRNYDVFLWLVKLLGTTDEIPYVACNHKIARFKGGR